MRLLAADTTTASASVCVVEGFRVLAARFRNPGETHSRHLLPMIEGVLKDAGLGLGEMQALACTLGPGSFTGLRIGITSLKGLAVAAELPMFGFSTLEVMACRFLCFPFPVCVMLDARRKEVYAQVFRVSGKAPEPLGPARVASVGDILTGLEGPMLFAGSGTEVYREAILAHMGERALWPGILSQDPDARDLAALAVLRGREGALPPAEILPLYLRKSDAELKWRQDA
ncbi:tRNA (adenosine(37)-N6)-threonylcarbamoyltransferase complex dimerization subunit type 1 TsaB [Desulfobotulus sp.]|jgi:tRNA threonylcarbamoyladenosine biosynthesis protein TsaB|uniref:tRNA (adenosine(37)-N6)-threonylcarbamoyltransferase complex dimerization subunit type 1 TsaB n=1 Tax=Desulfobotulus sp. TaxID=1940337 RepID=UPI002A362507|nr:tRNA (adenosine(37)-N6)-threonylcarbamoyltransferase complex dimerization subunit type 1 TsaB [Desulfobotulus sp.]MDY0161840.1 tRNA (adenosine(37)-N6)-threonylcarbamoyltransferase complex dimerization subunit type 1 TsaB [Desulfobotulus sp.]